MRGMILVIILLSIPFVSDAAVVERPSRKYEILAIQSYEWIYKIKKSCLTIAVNDSATKFISDDAIKRYIKLKLRNFVKDIEITDNCEGVGINYLYLKLELYKYNDKTGIHYGLISFKLHPAVGLTGSEEIYELTASIAGSEAQLLDFIKKEIDWMSEVYADDYFFIEDIMKKNSATHKGAQ